MVLRRRILAASCSKVGGPVQWEKLASSKRKTSELSDADRKAVEIFLRTRSITGTLDWTGLLGRNDSPSQRAADLESAVSAAVGRFLKKVHFDTLTGCWDWIGATDLRGYSRFAFRDKYAKRISTSGHRFCYQYFRGPILDGLHLDHLCGIRDCVNPFHLEAVTLRENSLRQARWARRKVRQPRCVHGHKFPERYPWPKKYRMCLTCRIRHLERRLDSLRSQLERKPHR